MSIKAMTWAWEQPVKSLTDRALLVALADFADDQHQCFPSQSVLAERCMCSVDTIQRALRRLEEFRLIERTKRGSTRGGRTSDLFTLKVRELNRKLRPWVKPHNRAVKQLNRKAVRRVKPHSFAVGTTTEPPEVYSSHDSEVTPLEVGGSVRTRERTRTHASAGLRSHDGLPRPPWDARSNRPLGGLASMAGDAAWDIPQ